MCKARIEEIMQMSVCLHVRHGKYSIDTQEIARRTANMCVWLPYSLLLFFGHQRVSYADSVWGMFVSQRLDQIGNRHDQAKISKSYIVMIGVKFGSHLC